MDPNWKYSARYAQIGQARVPQESSFTLPCPMNLTMLPTTLLVLSPVNFALYRIYYCDNKPILLYYYIADFQVRTKNKGGKEEDKEEERRIFRGQGW